MKTVKGIRVIVVFAVFAIAISFGAPAIEAGGPPCEARENNNSKKLLECVTLEGVREHQAEFQAIADANDDTRASGTDGYDDSAEYVVGLLADTGRYNVVIQEFEYEAFRQLGLSTLAQTAPGSVTYTEEVDYRLMVFSGAGGVTAPVTPVATDVENSGCLPAQFAGFPSGNIALIKRGTCYFRTKVENAVDAGASGVIIFNNVAGLHTGTLSTPGISIPVFSTTSALGATWASTPGLELHMVADVTTGPFTTSNIIAETLGGRDDHVVVVGAQLDSFFGFPNFGSPGINYNGSGAATILEIALQMKNVIPVNKVRFIWFGGEADGLIGSNYYVSNLTEAESNNIALYLGFDTIGSPNPVRFIYDGDPDIKAQFEGFYAAIGVPYKLTTAFFSGISFASEVIPVGSLFTGATGLKTVEEVAIFGGTAGQQYDPCFQLACDTFANVNLEVLDQNADAAAFAVIQNAMGLTSGKVKIKDKSGSSGLTIAGPEVK